MSHRTTLLLALFLSGCLSAAANGRTWTDSTGNYRVEADLIGFNTTTVVLKKEDHSLVAVPISQLSEKDQEYLRSKEAASLIRKTSDAMQTWTMASGLKVIGRVVGYGRRDVTIQQRRGNIYVNDRRLDNLPDLYQKMLPKIVTHFTRTPITDMRGLESWVTGLQGQSRTFTCEGVMLELENGDEYGVPFFLFSANDLNVLRPGWERWLAAAQSQPTQDQESFLLQAQTQAYQQDRMANQQIAMMQLQMQGYAAGMFDLWEVRLLPAGGIARPPLTVVVPARDSRSAAAEAMRRNPGYAPGPVRKVRREY